MEIEIGENLSWTLRILTIATAIAFISIKGCVTFEENRRETVIKAMENGYIEQPNITPSNIANGKIWVKPETK